MLKFIVKGSQGNEYQIVLEKSAAALNLSCTCAAGLSGTWCKHRFSLLAGEVSALLSNNTHDMAQFKNMITGSAIERRFTVICALEKEKERLDATLKAEKKAIGREMGGAPTSR
jgi:uncharacterized Zn finger protein